jgi:hypothetical protein
VEIFGQNLLFPREEGSEVQDGSADAFHPVRVTFGGRGVDPLPGSLTHTKSGEDRLKATVPAGLASGQYDVAVINFRGSASDSKQFEVAAT